MAIRGVLIKVALLASVVAAIALLPGARARVTSAVAATGSPRLHSTSITINGTRRGRVFDGVGAISGGGGTSRLLVDYPPTQQAQILDYLFKRGYGANVQLLKLEIGGDAEATDGAEPSFEHSRGHVNCNAGYEMWLARQAKERNPHIRFYALQWNGPGWVGNFREDPWTKIDIGYLLQWLHCAKTFRLHIGYLGGWDEHLPHGKITPAIMTWFEELRAALNKHGYGYIKIVGVDSARRSPDVSSLIATHRAFRRAIGVLGYHDICQYPTTGRTCQVPPAAKTSGKPIWATEIGALRAPNGPAAFARTINNAYIQAKATGILAYPLVSAMPAGMPEEDRGLVIASQPWSGNYQVSPLTWAMAQTTQFTQPGWLHVAGAAGSLGPGYGSYAGYEGPRRTLWSLVVQTTTTNASQAITVHVTGGLPSKTVQVWSTNLDSSDPTQWLTRGSLVTPAGGTFHYTLLPRHVYTFTTTTGQCPPTSCGTAPTIPPASQMPMPYSTSTRGPDLTGMPWGLEPADGSFEYPKGVTGYFQQTTVGRPTFWQPLRPLARFPYAVAGDYCLGNVPISPLQPNNYVPSWCPNPTANYTVTATVTFTGASQSAGVIARYYRAITTPIQYFQGYRFMVSQSGSWILYRDYKAPTNTAGPPPVKLASGTAGLNLGNTHTISLTVNGPLLTASADGSQVWQGTDPNPGAYVNGVAGIATSGWYPVHFDDLTISP
jgi:hypothetical protein